MLVSIFFESHDFLTSRPQTLNFGGKYLYTFEKKSRDLIVTRVENEKHMEGFFLISDSECNIDLVSAIVGENGVGKSTIMDLIRGIFVEHPYALPGANYAALVEINGETRVLHSDFDRIAIDELGTAGSYKLLQKAVKSDFQTIYYSPHLDLKYNDKFDDVDKYDISLDQYVAADLENLDKRGSNENGWKFHPRTELLFKNALRQVDFLSSEIVATNHVFSDVFNLPDYKAGILHFRDIEFDRLHNTPYSLRPIIELIFNKLEDENNKWIKYRNSLEGEKGDENEQARVNRYLLKRFIIRSFLSLVVDHMEKANYYLEEGHFPDGHNLKRFNNQTAYETFVTFIRESYVQIHKTPTQIFNAEEVLQFFEKLFSVFKLQTRPDQITKQSVRVDLTDIKEIIQLHKKVMTNLFHYYPSRDGLIEKSNYVEDIISFYPTDRRFSSGENALLNFFSRLYNFIDYNLVENRKSLPNKSHYILLLDEADLGFHPLWKKKYVNALLQTLPKFFENLAVVPSLQLVISTHDPLTLSDIPNSNVIFLQKAGQFCDVVETTNQDRIQKTFGANITDLLAHSFFVEEGLIGDFAKSKISETIDWINQNKQVSQKTKNSAIFRDRFEYFKTLVNLIDEKVIKIKLAEMLTEVLPDNEYYNEILEKEISYLERKKRI